MSEKKPTAEEVLQRIDELLDVLKRISQDLADVSKSLKAATGAATPSRPTIPSPTPMPAVPTGALRSAKDVQTMFPTELEDMLNFTETPQYIIIKPRRFLGSDNFAKIASIVRSNGGEYISAGKESHFKIPRETR
jgi:hypothetical protein